MCSATGRGGNRAYSNTLRGRVAAFFNLRNDSPGEFLNEVLGGVTLFLCTVYMLGYTAQTLATPRCFSATSPARNATALLGPLPAAPHSWWATTSATMGVATIVMGLLANVPYVVGPGVTFVEAFACMIATVPAPAVLAANLIVGLLLIPVALAVRNLHAFNAFPEDLRLGMGSGIAALLVVLNLQTIQSDAMPNGQLYLDTFTPPSLGKGGLPTGTSILALLSFVVAVALFVRERTRRWSVIGAVAVAAVILNATEAGTGQWASGASPASAAIPQSPFVAGVSFAGLGAAPAAIARYVVLLVVEKVLNVAATVTALCLVQVTHRMGYSRATFLEMLNNSHKFVLLYAADALLNVVVAPLMGTPVVTPFIESAAGIVVGARSGLAAVVAGTLFLVLTPVAEPVGLAFGSATSSGSVVFACFFVVQLLIRSVNMHSVEDAHVALLAFFLIIVTGIGFGSALAFVCMVVVSVLANRTRELTNPHVAFMFPVCVLYLVLSSSSNEPSVLAVTCSISVCAALAVAGVPAAREFRRRFPPDPSARNSDTPLSLGNRGARRGSKETKSMESHSRRSSMLSFAQHPLDALLRWGGASAGAGPAEPCDSAPDAQTGATSPAQPRAEPRLARADPRQARASRQTHGAAPDDGATRTLLLGKKGLRASSMSQGHCSSGHGTLPPQSDSSSFADVASPMHHASRAGAAGEPSPQHAAASAPASTSSGARAESSAPPAASAASPHAASGAPARGDLPGHLALV